MWGDNLCFDLHFPDDLWNIEYLFHLSVARLYIIFGECAFKSSVYFIFLVLLSKISWPYMNGLFLSLLFCFIGLSICLYASIILFISAVVLSCILKSGSMDASSFILFCSDIFGYSKFCGYIWILRKVLSISVKKVFAILMWLALNLWIALGRWTYFSILNFLIHEMRCLSIYVSPFISFISVL